MEKGDWLDAEFIKSNSDEQIRAMNIVREKMNLPDIDGREFTLLNLDFMSLLNIVNTQGAKVDLVLAEELELMRSEDLSEDSFEASQEWRKGFERRKAQVKEDIEKDREKVREIVARSQE